MTVEDSARADVPRAGMLISLAWNSTIAAVRAMPALFGSAALLALAVKLADIAMDYGADHLVSLFGRIGGGIAIALWGVVSLLLDACVLAPVAVAVHRMVLLEETTPGLISWKHPRIWRFAGWTLLLELVLGAVALPMIASRETKLEMLALIVFGALGAVISIRWLMIFPAVAVETPAASWKERILASWDGTRGHFWRLALALIGSLVMLFGPLVIVAVVLMFAASMSESFQLLYAVRLAFDLFGAALEPVSIGLGAAIASWFYMWLQENPAPLT